MPESGGYKYSCYVNKEPFPLQNFLKHQSSVQDLSSPSYYQSPHIKSKRKYKQIQVMNSKAIGEVRVMPSLFQRCLRAQKRLLECQNQFLFKSYHIFKSTTLVGSQRQGGQGQKNHVELI